MTVLAIDPGSKESAYVLWDGVRILQKAKLTNEAVCDLVGRVALMDMSVQCIAIEQIVGSYGQNAGMEVMMTAHWSGRFVQRWATQRSDASALLLPRKTVVTHVCGHGKANDSNVRAALIDRVGEVGKKSQQGPCWGVSADIWAALAVAVTAFDQRRLRGLG